MNSLLPDEKTDTICPYLGLPTDWQTAMDYPSMQNFCRRVKPPSSPAEIHQREFCLNTNYPQCNLYTAGPVQPAAPNVPSKPVKSRKHTPPLAWLILGFFFLIVIVFTVWQVLMRVLPDASGALAKSAAYPTIINDARIPAETQSVPTLKPISAVLPQVSPTVEIPTSPAAVAEQVFTTSPLHLLETPFGTEHQLLLHRVSSGEDLISIADTYHTSIDAIRTINFNLPQELWVGTVIIIPPDQTDVTGIIPMSPFEITSDGITVEALAVEQGIAPDLLADLNDRPPAYLFQTSEWVVLPHVQSTP